MAMRAAVIIILVVTMNKDQQALAHGTFSPSKVSRPVNFHPFPEMDNAPVMATSLWGRAKEDAKLGGAANVHTFYQLRCSAGYAYGLRDHA